MKGRTKCKWLGVTIDEFCGCLAGAVEKLVCIGRGE